MAWTVPKTYTPEDGLTSGELNTYIRDNMLELGPAKATAANQLLVASGLNTVAMRSPVVDHVNATVTTSSLSPTTLTGGPEVTFDHTGTFLVLFGARIRNTGDINQLWAANYGPEIVGATPADLGRAVRWPGNGFGRFCCHVLYYGIAPGSTTVRANYWVSDSTQIGEYAQRTILVIPL